MNEPYKRKKQPQAVRAQLLEAAARIVIGRGLAGLTLDLVARGAGVSKGGLIHHYPTRQALVTELFNSHLAAFQKSIEAHLAQDNDLRGRFTRAYVKATAATQVSPQESKLLGAFALAMSNDPGLAHLWFGWLKAQLEKHGEDADSVTGRLIRYAADGIWLEDCTGGDLNSAAERQAVVERLVGLTYTM